MQVFDDCLDTFMVADLLYDIRHGLYRPAKSTDNLAHMDMRDALKMTPINVKMISWELTKKAK